MEIAIDATDRGGSLALAQNGNLLEASYENSRRTHTDRLMPTISSFLENRDYEFEDIDSIYVATGPGSFTAIRLGVTTAKTLAMVCDAELIGLSSLRILAEYGRPWEGVIRSCIDARRGELYVQDFKCDQTLRGLNEPDIMTPERFVETCEEFENPLLIPRSRDWNPKQYEWSDHVKFYSEILSRPLAISLVKLGNRLIQDGQSDDIDQISPNYIRQSDARSQSGHSGTQKQVGEKA